MKFLRIKNVFKRIPAHAPYFFSAIFLLLLPFQTRYIFSPGIINDTSWEYGTLSIYISDIALAILTFFWILYSQQSSFPKKPLSNMSLTIAALWLITFSSLVWSKNHNLAAFGIVQLTKAALVFFIFRSLSLSKTFLAWLIVISGVIQSTFALLQFIIQRVFASTLLGISEQLPPTLGVSVIETNAGRFLRAYGTLPHPNILGGFLVVCIFFAGFLALTTNPRPRLIATTASIFITFALLLTFSRSALLGLVVGLIFCAILTTLHQRALAWSWLATIAATLIISALIFLPLLLPRLTANTRLEQLSTTTRVESIQQAVTVLNEHTTWFTGVGIYNYTQAVYNMIDDQKPGWWYQPVHNTPLLVLTEIGVIGSILFLILFLFFIPKTFRWILTPPHAQSSFTPFLMSAILSLFINSLFDHFLWTLPSMLLSLFFLFSLTETTDKK